MNKRTFAIGFAALALVSNAAEAGVFNIYHFVKPGSSAAGVEPEVNFSNGAGVGFNLKYTYGLNELSNVQAIIGSGTGPRRFRIGGNMTFDFFPDVPGQPGIGLATQLIYYRLPDNGVLEITGIPYIHKAYKADDHNIEPFAAVPLGVGFSDGNYFVLAQFVIGTMYHATENLSYVAELGVNINHLESYVSGGAVYYF